MENLYQNYHKYRGNNIYENNTYLPKYFLKILSESKEIHILDVGCGNGDILDVLKKRGYKYLQGIDLDADAVAYVKKRGIACENIDILEYKPEDKYDLIMMNHVLEHLPKKEVISILSYIRENLLGSDGRILIRVPNAQANTGCYWAYEDFTHETLYTAGSLKYIMKCAGYRNISFLDQYGLEENRKEVKAVKKFFLYLYNLKIDFWNYVTGSSFHKPSPRIYTWELKVIADK